MGQGQSQPPPKKQDYYSLLSISSDATTDEIKVAYKKAALKHHPDRNYGREEQAAEEFREIQAAYEVLTDTREREWYDSHKDHEEKFEDIITTAELLGYFDPTLVRKMDDSETGFYRRIQELFYRIEEEEEEEYPPFGLKDDSPQHFYAVWTSFSSSRSFAEADEYHVPTAPDRRIKRLMEKENKRLREAKKREFNETVRSLVLFIRKRDPRYKEISAISIQEQHAKRRKQQLNDRVKFAANLQDYEEQEWSKTDNSEIDTKKNGLDETNGEADDVNEDDENEEVEFECVVCRKSFKSENAFESHEKSKKHIKAVEAVRRKMHKEDRNLRTINDSEPDKEEDSNVGDDQPTEDDVEALKSSTVTNLTNETFETNNTIGDSFVQVSYEDFEDDVDDAQSEQNINLKERTDIDDILDSDEEIAEMMRAAGMQSTDIKVETPSETVSKSDDGNSSDEKVDKSNKKGRAKLKRERKKAKSQNGKSQNALRCNICEASFESRNKLFEHVKKEGHALKK